MFCVRCGARLDAGEQYCPECCRQAPLTPKSSRLARHIRFLGILWLAVSALRLIPGLVLLAFFGPGLAEFLPPEVPSFVFGLVRVVGVLYLAAAAFGIITGWGLLERQPWARMCAVVLGVLNLIEMPFGTALGIYTLWVLLPADSEEEYDRLSRAA